MKVHISFTVDIDPESWTLNYGVEGDKEIRADVKNYVETGTRDHLSELGLLKEIAR